MRSTLWFLVGLSLASPIENELQDSVQKRSSPTPCEVQSYQVATGTQAFYACSTTSGSDTVTSTITTPSGGQCGDYTAFPSTGFMAKPTLTAYNELCQYNFGSESKDGYCACQTTVSGSATSQWVPLPYTMESYTILDCHAITSVDFTSTTSTPTPTATASPSPTQNCIRYTIPDPSVGHYNSAKDQYIFVLYGISAWNTTAGEYEEKISGALKDCEVDQNVSIEEDTERWGTVAMWNAGRNWDFDECITINLDYLGAHDLTNDSCGGGLPTMNEDLEVKDSASEDMDYIESKFSDHVSSPYPLQS